MIAPFINGIEALPWFYEINCGGSAAGSYQADAFTTDGVTYSDSHSIDTSGVTNPAPVAVYQALRYLTTVGPITYTLPNLTPGASYRVRLHFSTPSDTGAGQREINVSLNGNSIVSGLDVWAAAGGVRASPVQAESRS